MPFDLAASSPTLSQLCHPPRIVGAAALTTAAFQGIGLDQLMTLVDRLDGDLAARLYDRSIVQYLAQCPQKAMALQRQAMLASPLFRVGRRGLGQHALRVLALVAPGDLMVNTPLDFITNHLEIQLDLLFVVPGCPLPTVIPDHDVMFVAISEADAFTLARLRQLCALWPRPVLNDPAALPLLARDALAQVLRDIPCVCSPKTVRCTHSKLLAACDNASLPRSLLSGAAFPLLVRPVGSHAGIGLKKIESHTGLVEFMSAATASEYYVTQFYDYRSKDGMHRKYRVAFIDREPFLCHMAVSVHWMVHYLNAGMTESEHKRADEADAMIQFDRNFAARHKQAFAGLNEALPFDAYSIDCSELPDGRLLVFEADTAAIIHAMDPVEAFPYKHIQMRRVFEAFGAMLHRRSGAVAPGDKAGITHAARSLEAALS